MKRNPMCSVSSVLPRTAYWHRAIVRPLDIPTSSSAAGIVLRATLVWIVSLVLAPPEAIFSDLHVFNVPSGNKSFVTCAPYPPRGELHPKIHSAVSFLVFYIIPLLVIAVYYTFIASSLTGSVCKLPVEGKTHARRQVESRKRLAKTVLAFVALCAECWLAGHAIFLCRSYHYSEREPSEGVQGEPLLFLP
ncbi:gastrin-releasing peptide receptor [Phycodurus eques]|uniref:gastrin-releasing peptide receptor n=1 Tax=Phycodurus eques TaxID=693459 RepID=UPI002ACDD046|nr:gastrin-releasing peptide receptor [Phycodurus eques]